MTEEFVKKCLVCGDKAVGNNFDALSCESCKAFFRRNAVKNKELKCHFDDKCKIELLTRRHCKKCRLKKCFDIGMKRDWILSETEKKERKHKIELNRKKRKHSESSVNNSNNDSSDSGNTGSSEKGLEGNGKDVLEFPLAFDELDLNIDEINTQIWEIENFIEEVNPKTEISDSIFKKAVKLEFSIIPIARPIIDQKYTFNELEGIKLSELLNATNILMNPITKVTSKAMNKSDVFRVLHIKIEQEVGKVVQMSKRLAAFNSICDNDRIALIKYGSLELFSMRSNAYFDCKYDCFTVALDNDTSVLVNLFDFCPQNFGSKFRSYLHKFQLDWDLDSIVLDLLTAIVLFNPDRPNLLHRELVKLQQHIYMYLLQRYLQIKYRSESESKLIYLRLLNTLIDLNDLGKTQMAGYAKKDPKIISPLMREILEIKSY